MNANTLHIVPVLSVLDTFYFQYGSHPKRLKDITKSDPLGPWYMVFVKSNCNLEMLNALSLRKVAQLGFLVPRVSDCNTENKL